MGNPWIIGGAILGIGLIGGWLLGSGGSSTKTRPDGMPQSNTAVRGSPFYVTFGANRVYPQVVWTKHFNAVRQQSSGKGGAKGGGSGGLGSMKGGGSAGQQYEYFWDMIFNFGTMDTPMLITRGWSGGDPLDDNTVNSILNGAIIGKAPPTGDNIFQVLINYMKSLSQVNHDNGTASLKFTSCFFAPGYNTGDPDLSTWDYFHTQEDVECQWPSTAWIGFQQLDLGPSPSIPQLSFEFVPQSLNVTTGDGYLSKCGNGTDGGRGSRYAGHDLLRDANGEFYALDDSSGSSYRALVTNVRTGTQSSISDATFSADSGGLAWSISIPVPDTQYFYMCGYTTYTINGNLLVALLYQVNTDGTISYTGHSAPFKYDVLDFFNIGQNISAIGRRADGMLCVAFNGNESSTWLSCAQLLPNPDALIDPTLRGGFISKKLMMTGFNSPSDFEGCVGGCFSNRANNMQAGVVAADTDTDNWVFYYVGLGEIAYHAAHSPGDTGYVSYIADNALIYPNGFMIGARLTLVGDELGVSELGIFNDYFQDQDGNPLVPFADAGTGVTGAVTGSVDDDWFTPGGNGFVTISRSFSDDHSSFKVNVLANSGTAAKSNGADILTTLTADDLGTADEGMPNCINVSVSQTGAMFATINYDGGSFNPGTVQVSVGMALLDVTPAYIVYRILTSPVFGFQTNALFGYSVTVDRINQTSYEAAVAWCVEQGIFVSVTYTESDNLLDILNELVSLYNGFLTDEGGVVQFGVVTGSDIPVRTIDNDHLVADKGQVPVKVTKAALEDGYNRIQFNYLDRALDYNQNQVQVDDEVDQDINTIRLKTYDARFVMNGSVALQIANRALWQNLYGKDQYQFSLGWKDSDLSKGDLITLVDSFEPTLFSGVRARIVKWQNSKRGKYDVTAVREFPYIATATVNYTQTSTMDGGWGTLVTSIFPCFHQTAYELPQEFQAAKAYVYFGYEQASTVMGAQLYLSLDGGNYVLTQDTQPYIISAVVNADLPVRNRGYVEQNIDFFLFPTSPFNASAPTFVQTYDLDDVSPAIRAAGGGTLIIGSEALAMENLTLLGQNHYRAQHLYRGWGGTVISDHSSGNWFHQHAAGIFLHEVSLQDIGNNVSYKIVPYNFAGQTANIASIDASTYTIRGTYWLPRVQPRTHIAVPGALAWSGSADVVGPYIGVASGGSDVVMWWEHTAQTEGYGAGGYGAGGYGHEVDDGNTTGWRVDVASKNGHFVSSFVVNTQYFRYTQAQNVSDFGSFGRDLLIKTTPFNVKGDGPVSDVRTLSMNW